MKLFNYRAKDILQPKNKTEFLSNCNQEASNELNVVKKDESRLCLVLESLENMIASYIHGNPQQSYPTQNLISHSDITRDLEPRDRFVTFKLPTLYNKNSDDENAKKARKKQIETWVGNVCKTSISIGFNYFLEKKVEEKQMKVFICENFLRNLVSLVQKCNVTAEEMEIIDKLLKEKVLPYSKAKYPLTGESEVNKALKNSVKSIDNSQMVQNDYIYSSNIYFEYRQSGRYEDLIMELANEIMKRFDEKMKTQNQGTITNFQAFEKLMGQTFQKSFNESWMLKTYQNDIVSSQVINEKQQRQRKKIQEEYKQKVQAYTSILIGRKISQNTQLFTANQISSKSISIKSPAILRVLTKWCQELWQKFNNQNYFLEKNYGISAGQKKEVQFLSKEKKKKLMELIKEEKEKIKRFTNQIYKKSYHQQIKILLNEFENEEDGFIERKERVSANFAWKSANNIDNFIVSYLNRLIHGLTTVSKKVKENWKDSQTLNLVTFHVSDLFRCQYTSKEPEVLAIFEELQKMSNQNTEKFKIIRIKNRLDQGTHDIMINAKFNNVVNCQIQITVNTSQSEFMRCSKKINHFIYELERAQFGPIMEICSVWRHYENKANIFAKFMKQERLPKKQIKIELDKQKKQEHNQKHWTPEEDPFICSSCNQHYHNNSFFQKHMKKKDSSQWKCGPCLIQENFNAKNREFFFNKKDKLFGQYQFIKQSNAIPNNGAYIFINKPNKEVVIFKKTYQNFNMKTYLVGLKNNKPSTLIDITSEKQIQDFCKHVLLFSLPATIVSRHLNYAHRTFEANIDKEQLAPEYLKACFEHESEVISISQERNLTSQQIKKVFDENTMKLKCLSNIHFRSICLKDLDFLSAGLKSVINKKLNQKQIKYGQNQSTSLLENLEKLEVSNNQIQTIPIQIQNLKKLRLLDLSYNKIKKLPDEIKNLKSLIELNLTKNSFEKIPEEINQLSTLQTLYLRNNDFHIIPPKFGNLPSLQTLSLSDNKLQIIPSNFCNLSSLKKLYLNNNKINSIAPEFIKLTSLQTLTLEKNLFETIPPEIGQLQSLEALYLRSNQIHTIPSQFCISSLQKLYLSDNKLSVVPPEFCKLSSLQILSLNNNKFQTIPPELCRLPALQTLYLNGNQIGKIPPEFCQLSSLQVLYLNTNQLKDIPLEFCQLSSLQVLYINENQIQTIPPQFCQLPSLQTLYLRDNQLEAIPSQFYKLSSLQTLYLNSNKIQTIPPQFCQLPSLETLSLRNNKLQTIPPEFGQLTSLQTLYLRSNQIQTIPPEFCQLSSLQTLYLSNNQIQTIPPEICNLSSLQTLSLNNNQLSVIPLELSHLPQLQTLYLSDNKIQQIPTQLSKLPSLKQLFVNNNPISRVPDEIKKFTKFIPQQIRSRPPWLQSHLTQKKIPLENEMNQKRINFLKIISLGNETTQQPTNGNMI